MNQGDILNNKMSNVKLSKSYPNKSPPNDTRNFKQQSKSPSNNLKYFSNLIPAKVEAKIVGESSSYGKNVSRPIDIIPSNRSSVPDGTPQKNVQKKTKRFNINGSVIKNQTFGTPIDDPILDEDFDFEKNLALFDKQAIWDEIDSLQKPDLVQTVEREKKYRHDQNVITSDQPTQYRQIETLQFENSQEYVNDVGLIIPSIPLQVRNKIQNITDCHGLSFERQCDDLSRSTTELAIQLLGGASRLIPKNQHQWPTVAIICDEPYNERQSEIGLSTGRHLASQGLKVVVYINNTTKTNKPSKELELFAATGNEFTTSTKYLPSADLVILAVHSIHLDSTLIKWINDNRAPVLAIDPPVCGIYDVSIKCSILPILPLDELSSDCGKLYLCNLGIPDRFFRDAGIKYKSPFGHKFIIPIHKVKN